MKIDILERGGYKATKRIKTIIEDKLAKLDKYFDDNPAAKVVLYKVAKQDKLEITISSKGLLFRCEVASDNMYSNIDYALPKLEKQIVRYNEKKKGKKKSKTIVPEFPYEFLEESPEELPAIYKTKTFNLDPMPVDEARFAIERLGHDFFAFLNAESGRVNILYRRKDGKFGLIDLKY